MEKIIGGNLREISKEDLKKTYGAADMQPEKRTSMVCLTVSGLVSSVASATIAFANSYLASKKVC